VDVDARLRTMLLRFFLAELWRQVCVSELQKERANLAFWVSESVKNVLIARFIWQCLLLPNAASAANLPEENPEKANAKCKDWAQKLNSEIRSRVWELFLMMPELRKRWKRGARTDLSGVEWEDEATAKVGDGKEEGEQGYMLCSACT